jgi:hypothetical protein
VQINLVRLFNKKANIVRGENRPMRSKVLILTVLFLSLAVVYNGPRESVAFCEDSVLDHLSPPLSSDDLAGIEYKDMARLKIALEANLNSIARNERIGDIANQGISTVREDTIFHPVDMQFFFSERKILPRGFYSVMCRVRDSPVAIPRTYYAIFSFERDESGGFPLFLYTQKEYLRSKAFIEEGGYEKDVYPGRKRSDVVAIERYVRINEKAIDHYIKRRIDSGDFAEIEGRGASLGWDSEFPGRTTPSSYWPEEYLERVKSVLDSFLGSVGTSIDKAFEGKNIVFIKVDGEDYPVVREKGRDMRVGSHTSANAVYVFLTEDIFNMLNRNASGLASADPDVGAVNLAIDSLALRFLHEVGVSYGLKFNVVGAQDRGKIRNDLFKAHTYYSLNLSTDSTLMLYPDLKRVNYNTVDLNKIAGRDYISGPDSAMSSDDMSEMMKEAWLSAGDDISRPFTQKAQAAFARIKELDRVRHAKSIPVTSKEYFMIYYSQVFGEQRYDGVVRLMQWAVDNREGKLKKITDKLLDEKAFIEIYFLARLLDGRGVDIARIMGEPFVDLYADQLFGKDQGHRTLREIYGGEWDEPVEKMKGIIVGHALALAEHNRSLGKYDAAINIIETLITFSVNERLAITGEEALSERERKKIDDLRKRISDENGLIVRDEDRMERAIRLGEMEGLYDSTNLMISTGVKTPFEHELVRLRRDIVEEKQKETYAQRSDKSREAEEMAELAAVAGLKIPTHPQKRYTLLLTSEFFANGELDRHQQMYGDRFNLESISARDNGQFVDKVIKFTGGIEARSVVLVPDTLTEEQLGRIASAGIRFIRTDTDMLLQARADRDDARQSFQLNTYATMLLARKIDENTTEDSSIYRLLNFYLRSLFSLGDNVKAGDYIKAIVTSKVTVLLKGILSYRPAEPYRVPEYDMVAATLISA